MEKLTFLLLNIFMLSAFGKGKQCPNLNNNCYFDELIALIRKRFFFLFPFTIRLRLKALNCI